jgi:hypothetical protein
MPRKRSPFRPPAVNGKAPYPRRRPPDGRKEADGNRAAPEARPRSGGRRSQPSSQLVQGEPQKLHKMLAQAGLGSRRELEDWIVAGRVSVNGKPAHVGQRIGPEDKVRVNGRLINCASPRAPRASCSTTSRKGKSSRATIRKAAPRSSTACRASAAAAGSNIGRLDFNTEGLLMFTTSGELANKPDASELRAGARVRRARHRRTERGAAANPAGGDRTGRRHGPNSIRSMAVAKAPTTGTASPSTKAATARCGACSRRSAVQVSRLIRVRYGPFDAAAPQAGHDRRAARGGSPRPDEGPAGRQSQRTIVVSGHLLLQFQSFPMR